MEYSKWFLPKNVINVINNTTVVININVNAKYRINCPFILKK